MRAFLIDLHQTGRSLLKTPVFTAAAVLTLALGVGLDSAMIAVFDRLLLRPLPFENTDGLVGVYEGNTQLGWTRNVLSAPNFEDFRREATRFEAMSVHAYSRVVFANDGDPKRVLTGRVSHTFFSVLGVRPELGRDFTEEEDREGGPKAVMLTHEFWSSHFGGDPSIVGTTIQLDSVPHEVAGVLPARFHVAGRFGGDIYIPMAFSAEQLADRARHSYSALGRLKPGETIENADAELRLIAERLAEQFPETNEYGTAYVAPLIEALTRRSVPWATLFVSLSSFLLLIACANISNLILVRGASHQREMAIRCALGADRAAVVRRIAAELLWLGAAGGLLSLFVAYGLVRLIQNWFPGVPQINDLALDARSLVIGLAVTFVAVGIAGIIPAWRLSRASLSDLMRDGARAGEGPRQMRLQSALLAVQVALSLVLLTGAGLMARTLIKLQEVPLGFETRGVLAADVVLPSSRYASAEERAAFARRLRDALGDLPQVRQVAVANSLPFRRSQGNWPYAIEGEPPRENQSVVWVHAVTPGYFDLLEIPLTLGRMLDHEDPEACVVNGVFVRGQWPEGDPLGKRVQLNPPQGPTCVITGVVGDSISFNLAARPNPQIYASIYHDTFQGNNYQHVYLKGAGDSALVASQVREAVHRLDPALAADPIRPLEALVDAALVRTRVATSLVAGFAVLGLLLAAVGLYGLMAFSVTRRTRELAIRKAFGADRSRLIRLVLGQSLRQISWGLGLGLLGCVVLRGSMAAYLFGVSPMDAPTLIATVLVIVVVSLLAAWIPAMRAAAVPPAQVLRIE